MILVQEGIRKPAKCKARVAPEGFLAKKSEPRCNLLRDPSPFSDKHYSYDPAPGQQLEDIMIALLRP
jgi:hypothetical protein